MTDIPKTIVSDKLSTAQPIRVGDRAIVNNLDANNLPGPYHGCACTVVALFRVDGEPCARVRFLTKTGHIEKKLPVTKLERAERPKVATPERKNTSHPLPDWAADGTQWTLGRDLQRGDILYFSHIANPRFLCEEVRPGYWRTTVIAEYYGRVRNIPNQHVDVNLNRWYVVKRVVR